MIIFHLTRFASMGCVLAIMLERLVPLAVGAHLPAKLLRAGFLRRHLAFDAAEGFTQAAALRLKPLALGDDRVVRNLMFLQRKLPRLNRTTDRGKLLVRRGKI